MDNIEYEKIIGINIMYVKFDENSFPENGVYFIAYTNETNINNKLDYFTFAYFLANIKDEFKPLLKEDQMKLKIEINQNNYKISFYPIPLNGTSYYIKAYYKEGFIKGENVETIAISESPGIYIQINDPSFEKDKQIDYSLSTIKKINCIKILASLDIYEYKVYNLYKPEFVNQNEEGDHAHDTTDGTTPDKSDKIGVYVLIGVGSFLLIVVVILIVFIVIYKRRNKNLMENVNKISFVKSGVKIGRASCRERV